jgi:hypothetical protein
MESVSQAYEYIPDQFRLNGLVDPALTQFILHALRVRQEA